MSEAKSVDEKKLQAIENFISDLYEGDGNLIDSFRLANQILQALQAFDEPNTVNVYSGIDYKGEIIRYEQLEVDIDEGDYNKQFYIRFLEANEEGLIWFKDKQEAIDFCEKHGLKIKEVVK